MIWRGLLSPARKVERVDGTQPCWCDACGVSLPKVRRVIFQAKRLIPSGTCHPLVAAVITSKRKDSRGRRLGGNAICTHGRRRLENTNTRAHAREIRDPQDPSYRLYGVVFIKAENICARIVWYCIVLFCFVPGAVLNRYCTSLCCIVSYWWEWYISRRCPARQSFSCSDWLRYAAFWQFSRRSMRGLGLLDARASSPGLGLLSRQNTWAGGTPRPESR